MVARTDNKTLRREAVESLALARSSILVDVGLIRQEMQPRRIVQRSLENHLWLTVSGAALLGMLTAQGVRSLFPSHRPEGNSPHAFSAQRKSVFNLAFSALKAMALKQLIAIASERFSSGFFQS